MNRFEEAEESIKIAIGIDELSKDEVEIAQDYRHLGAIYRDRQMFDMSVGEHKLLH